VLSSDLAVVFPGQGAQYIGMDAVIDRELLAEADAILGRPLSKICAEGPLEELTDTGNAQPAVFLADISYWRRISARLSEKPLFMAGHSLGEYAAYCAAGALDLATALKLVQRRAQLMAAAARKHKGGMAAVIGLGAAQVQKVLDGFSEELVIANYNSPQQVVISGSWSAIDVARPRLAAAGAKKVAPLAVSGAFHSTFMAEAAEEFAADIEGATIREARIPVISNVLARPARDVDEIKKSLKQQISGSVLWEQSVLYMAEHGAGVFLEAGPGKVLTGLIKRIAPACTAMAADSFKDDESLAVDLPASLAASQGG